MPSVSANLKSPAGIENKNLVYQNSDYYARVRAWFDGHRAHPLLAAPNRITERDFAGWVQERGLYMPSTFDAAVTAMAPTIQREQRPSAPETPFAFSDTVSAVSWLR